jgi:hypothetical protein
LARGILQVIAVAAPFPADNTTAVESAAKLVGVDRSRFLLVLGTLQDAGVLRVQRAAVRISPDVLSDHIGYRAVGPARFFAAHAACSL